MYLLLLLLKPIFDLVCLPIAFWMRGVPHWHHSLPACAFRVQYNSSRRRVMPSTTWPDFDYCSLYIRVTNFVTYHKNLQCLPCILILSSWLNKMGFLQRRANKGWTSVRVILIGASDLSIPFKSQAGNTAEL